MDDYIFTYKPFHRAGWNELWMLLKYKAADRDKGFDWAGSPSV
jgi:hypothetical protein